MKSGSATGALLQLSQELHDFTSLEEVMKHVLTAVEAHTRYRRAWLMLPLSPTRGLEIVGFAMAERDLLSQRLADLDFGSDAFIRLRLEGSGPLIWEDVRREPRANPEMVARFGSRTLISVPMLRIAERIGCFNVGTFAPEGILPPTQDEVDFVTQLAALVSSVAARIRAEQAQRAMIEASREAHRLESLGRMAGEVAHDFNNMLMSIMGNNDEAQALLGDHPVRELLEQVGQAATRAAGLSRQLLAFSKGQPLERKELSLSALVDNMLPMLRSLLPSRLELEASHDPKPWLLLGDAGQIEQVVMNLVVNARDAMRSEGKIHISTGWAQLTAEDLRRHPGGRPGTYVVVTVVDTGDGMPGEVQARLFEPFFSTKAFGVGTGLGLAVVDSVLKRHDGFAAVQSSVGHGTTFSLYFPAHEPGVVAATPAAPPVTRARGGELLLIADDDPGVRLTLERVLVHGGYRVLLASDGDEALALLAANSDVGLVLADLVMPNLGGDEVRKRLAAMNNAPPLLIMSGYAPGAALTDFEHLLTKPFAPRQLLSKIREVLDGPAHAALD